MAKKKKNDAYAICTAQKKKSGMSHDEWKRCVNKVQQKESVMNFYERAAKLIEGGSPYSSRPHKPRSGDAVSRSRSTGRGPMTDAEREADKAAGDAATAAVLKKSAEIAAKKKQQQQSDGDDKPSLNASKKKKVNAMKVNAMKEDTTVPIELNLGFDDFLDSSYKSNLTDLLDEMAAIASDKGMKKKKKKINDEDDDQIERDEADRQEKADAAEDEEEAKTGQAVEDTSDDDDEKAAKRAKELAQTAQDSAERGNTATTDTGWRDKLTGKPTFAPKGTSADAAEREKERKLNASKKPKMKVKEAESKDKKWIQKAVDPDHEGYCTPMTKDTCTPKRKALAKTFKKMGRKRDRETKAKDEK